MNKQIKLNESQLRKMIAENVKAILKEYQQDIDSDTYFGGGLPDPNTQENKYTYEKEITEIYNQIKPYIDKLSDILNNSETNDITVYNKVISALNVIDTLPSIGKLFYSVEQ